jgi:hypothetical protein
MDLINVIKNDEKLLSSICIYWNQIENLQI